MNKNNEATEINKENAKTKVRVAISDKTQFRLKIQNMSKTIIIKNIKLL